MPRALAAVLLIAALAGAAQAQSFLSLFGKSEAKKEEAAKPDAQRIEEARRSLEEGRGALDKAREETAAETAELEARVRALRAALDAGPAPEERDVLSAERDAAAERIALLRERLDAVDGRVKALEGLIEALQRREAVRAASAAPKEDAAAKSAYTLQESEAARAEADAARRSADLANATLETARSDLAAARTALEERKKAVERLRAERAAFDEAARAQAGLDEAGAGRLNRRTAAMNLRAKTAEDWIGTVEREIETALLRAEAGEAAADAARSVQEKARAYADAVAAKIVVTPEQLALEKEALAQAEAGVAGEIERARKDHDRDFKRLDRFTKEVADYEKKRAETQDPAALADLDERLLTSRIRLEGAKFGVAAFGEREAAAHLQVDLAEARVAHLEARLAAGAGSADAGRLREMLRTEKEAAAQWKKRRDAANAALREARHAAGEVGAALSALNERTQALAAKADPTPAERTLLPILEDRQDAMVGRRRLALYAVEALTDKAELLGQIQAQRRKTEEFLDERVSGGPIRRTLAAWSASAAEVRDRVWPFVKSIAILVLGLFLAGWLSKQAARPLTGRGQVHLASMARKILFYLLAFFTVTAALGVLKIQIGTLLATAGILTVAIGFAAQNSVGNIISGIFLLIDRPFRIGEWVEVDGQSGVVVSIDLLSTRIRTFENLLVRIPNETLVKSKIVNYVAHPVRRFDVDVGVAYHEDVERVLRVLRELAHNHRDVLEDPRPEARILGFGASSVDLRLRFWARWQDGYRLTGELRQRIKEAFDREDISIPFPQQVEWSGEVLQAQLEERRRRREAAAPPEGAGRLPGGAGPE